MIGWWSEQSPFLRYGVAIFFLALSTVIWFAGWFWPWGWGIGIILFLMAGPSDSEKKGYHF